MHRIIDHISPSPRTACYLIIILICSMVFLSPGAASGSEAMVKIGVLAKRGPIHCLNQWSPTADYLTRSIPDKAFIIIPLGFDNVYDSVKNGEVDFILVNSSFYVELEAWFGVNRIATLKNLRAGRAYTQFGGVLFTRKDKTDIRQIDDLIGKSFMAVDKASFGGWRMIWRELAEYGIEPDKDFKSLEYGGTHDAVVMAVKKGRIDAGTVRTDTLERMEQEGKISIANFHILHSVDGGKSFPFLLSTRLYPEWPMAMVKHTDGGLAKQVAAALLQMDPQSETANAAKSAGWTIPLNYQPVHECLKILKIGPYKDTGRISPVQVIRQYWPQIISAIILFVVLSFSTAVFYRLNRRIYFINSELIREVDTRTKAEREKEQVIQDLRAALAEVKTLQGFLPICSNCNKIRDDEGYWQRVEKYIQDRSDATFSHSICPDCLKILYPEFYDTKKGKE